MGHHDDRCGKRRSQGVAALELLVRFNGVMPKGEASVYACADIPDEVEIECVRPGSRPQGWDRPFGYPTESADACSSKADCKKISAPVSVRAKP